MDIDSLHGEINDIQFINDIVVHDMAAKMPPAIINDDDRIYGYYNKPGSLSIHGGINEEGINEERINEAISADDTSNDNDNDDDDDDILSIDHFKIIDNPYSDLTSSSEESEQKLNEESEQKLNKLEKRDAILSDDEDESEDEYHFVEAMNVDNNNQYGMQLRDKPLKSALRTEGSDKDYDQNILQRQWKIAYHRKKIKKIDQEIDELKKKQILKKKEEMQSKGEMEEWLKLQEALKKMVEIAKKAQDENTKNESNMSTQSNNNKENGTYLIGRVPISVLLTNILQRQNNKQDKH